MTSRLVGPLVLVVLAGLATHCGDGGGSGTDTTVPSDNLHVSSDTLQIAIATRGTSPVVADLTLRGTRAIGAIDESIAYTPAGDSGWLEVEVALDSGVQVVLSNSVTPGLSGGEHRAQVTVRTASGATGRYWVVAGVRRTPVIQLETSAIPGYDTVVDAVTKASDVSDGVKLRVDQVPDPSDSVKDVVVTWGDGTANYRKLNGVFPLAVLYSIGHWFVVDTASPEHGRGTLRATVTTWAGHTSDTVVAIHVLTKCEHAVCGGADTLDSALTIQMRIDGPVYTGNAYSVAEGVLPPTDYVLWIEDAARKVIRTLRVTRDLVTIQNGASRLFHTPIWAEATRQTDSTLRASLGSNAAGTPTAYDGITAASVAINNAAVGDIYGVDDTTIVISWDLRDSAGTQVPVGEYYFCAEVANIHVDTTAQGTHGPVIVSNECGCGVVQTATGTIVASPPTAHILDLSASVR